eukprot:1150705-Pelagomonas_calceolata.AAC.6
MRNTKAFEVTLGLIVQRVRLAQPGLAAPPLNLHAQKAINLKAGASRNPVGQPAHVTANHRAARIEIKLSFKEH